MVISHAFDTLQEYVDSLVFMRDFCDNEGSTDIAAMYNAVIRDMVNMDVIGIDYNVLADVSILEVTPKLW